SRVRVLIVAVSIIFPALFPNPVSAQGRSRTAAGNHSPTASITCTVRDYSGGAIPGATVQVTHGTGGTPGETISDAEGVYQAADLAPSDYQVAVALDGFVTRTNHVVVGAGQSATADVTLNPARFSQSVVV